MSTVFGVPPPPRPTVVEAGGPIAPPPSRSLTRRELRRSDTDRWRRRGVLTLTLLSVTLLVLANVATWTHFRGLDAEASAPAAAEASLDRAKDEARAVAVPALTDSVEEYYGSTGQPVPATTATDVAAAIDLAVDSDEFSAVWEDAVEQALTIEIAKVEDIDLTTEDGATSSAFVDVDLAPIAPVANDAMAADGYAFLAGETDNLGRYAVPMPSSETLPYGLVNALDSWWWALLLLGVALGVAALVLARRRLRLGFVYAADLALGFGLTLIGVAVASAVVRGQADAEYRDLSQDVFDGLTRSLVVQTVVLLIVALVAAITCAVLARRERPAPPA